MTKTFLDVLQDLSKAFSDAIRPEGLRKPDIVAPFIVVNDTGFDITLDLKKGGLYLHSSHLPHGSNENVNADSVVVFKSPTLNDVGFDPRGVSDCRVSHGGKVYLQARHSTGMSQIHAFKSQNNLQLEDKCLYVRVNCVLCFRQNRNHI